MAAQHGRRHSKSVYIRRRIGVGVAALAIIVGLSVVTADFVRASSSTASTTTTSTVPETTTTTVSATPLTQIPPGPRIAQRRLKLIGQYYSNSITPKSVNASGTGFVYAQNMVYRKTVSVFNARSGRLVKTISSAVDLSKFGYPALKGTVLGAPVEGAFSPDGKDYWITNYSMYGPNMGPEGLDTCSPSSARAAGDTPDYAYRIDTATWTIDRVVRVGLVPKFIATSPDGKWVLVTNWCSWDLNLIATSTNRVVTTIPMPATPRGIAVDPASHFAYIAIMGGEDLVKVDLHTGRIVGTIYCGLNPRTVVLSPDGAYAYVSLNAPGAVTKIDLATGRIVGTVHTGTECRSLVISTDGSAIFVVNYGSATMTMLRARNLAIIETVNVPSDPIGITFDPSTAQVWVSSYSGYITRFALR